MTHKLRKSAALYMLKMGKKCVSRYLEKFHFISSHGVIPGVDPGFLEGGFRSFKRGFVFNISPDFS